MDTTLALADHTLRRTAGLVAQCQVQLEEETKELSTRDKEQVRRRYALSDAQAPNLLSPLKAEAQGASFRDYQHL